MLLVVVCLFSLLLLLAIYLLFAPAIIEVNSHFGLYRLSLFPVFSFRWIPDDLFGHPELNILGFRVNNMTQQEKSHGKFIPKHNKKKRRFEFKLTLTKVLSVIQSFKVKRWVLNIDCGDMALNGQLYPVMYCLRKISGKDCRINFCGINEVNIKLENNAFRILKALIK